VGRVAELFAFVAVVGGFAVVLAGFWWLAARVRRRGLGGAVMGPIEEIYHPGAQRSRMIIDVQEQRGTTADDQYKPEPHP